MRKVGSIEEETEMRIVCGIREIIQGSVLYKDTKPKDHEPLAMRTRKRQKQVATESGDLGIPRTI